MKDDKYTHKNAKSLFADNKFEEALIILEKLWNDSNKDNQYILFLYGRTLRKLDRANDFIEICRSLGIDNPLLSNTFIKSVLCWCIYDYYIKPYTYSDNDSFPEFLKRAEYIIQNSEQLEAKDHFKTPYYFTVRRVVKAYNARASTNYREIIKWLSHLEPDKLSEETFSFKDEMGKDRELASPKEFYFQHMAKCLEKTGKYEKCIEVCESAFSSISKFHYRNNMWIKGRMHFCKCMMKSDISSAIEEYKKFANKHNFWFVYHKLAQIYFRNNKLDDALFYACKALNSRYEYEKMVNLLFDTGLLWQANSNNENAAIFFQASAYYRNLYEWKIPEELQYTIESSNLNILVKPDITKIKKICSDYLESIEGKPNKLFGKITKIFPHGCAGFIKPDSGNADVFFNIKNVVGNAKVCEGTNVSFDIKLGKDTRKIAVNIKIRSNKDG